MTNMPDDNDNSSFDSVKSDEQYEDKYLDDYYNIATNEKEDSSK